jgi:phage tail sheath protein FI
VLRTGLDVLRVLDAASRAANPGGLLAATLDDGTNDAERTLPILLDGGNDGERPGADEYHGEADDDSTTRTGLTAFEAIEDISIVAAPGSTYRYEHEYRDNAATILGYLISHCERMKYRIAVLDSGDGQTLTQVRAQRGRLDSSHAALYYPWVTILDPITRREIAIPPSGSVAGIYARNDTNRAVWKAPANEVVNVALDFEHRINQAQQEVLNPEGVNCLRFFEGRGFRVWGARTVTSDPEWKYVNLRRYFAYLERSIDVGTQWAVFEPNAEALWTNVRLTISDFLFNEWASGALLGSKSDQAYFVRCDRSTMTQNDLDNGRLICLIGVAAIRPAEFVIFRIGQWTANRPS